MDPALGRHHPTVRWVRALRRDAGLRRSEGAFVAEGRHLVEEALGSGAEIELALYSEPLLADATGRDLLDALQRAGVTPQSLAPKVLDGLQDARSPQPVLIVARHRPLEPGALLEGVGPAPLVVVACDVQDPGNLGTLLRTADAAGADAFCAAGATADLHHPRTVRGTMGSIFRVPACRAAWPSIRDALTATGVRCVGTVASGGEPLRSAVLTGALALVFGGEGPGLDPEVLATLDGRISVPMRPGVESLSVGAAAAVVLFEAAHQRAQA